MNIDTQSITKRNFLNDFPVIKILDIIDDIVIILNEGRQIVYHNKALTRITDGICDFPMGLRPGKALNCIHSGEELDECGTTSFCKNCAAFNAINKALSNNSSKNECIVLTKHHDGIKILDFEVKTLPHEFNGKKYVIFVLRDIVDLKKGRVFEETFYEMFQNMKSGVAVYEVINSGEDFIFKFFNQAAENIDNIAKGNVVGKKVTDVFPGIKNFGLFDVIIDVWKTGTPQSYPTKFYQDNRITGWRENYVFKLPTGEVVAIYNDITEQKKAEELLADAKNWLDLILTTINSGIVIIDFETHIIIDINKKGQEMFGLSNDNITGNICHTFLCPAEQGQCPITDLNMSVDHSERKMITGDGQCIPILKTTSIGEFNGHKYIIESFLDISKQKELEKRLEEVSLIDELTQIGNRRAFVKDLEKAMDYCNYNHVPLAVIITDIDNFKDYNDIYGHVQGDECLYKIAEVIKNCLKRPYDNVYRYGGEEFIVVLPNTDKNGAYLVAETIRKAIINEQIIHEGSTVSDFVSLSLGVFIKSNSTTETFKEIVLQADKNLYKAKKNGKNCVK